MVLLPIGGKNYYVTGLLETFWKCLEVIMDKHISRIEFHGCLCGFLGGIGTGTATTEVRVAWGSKQTRGTSDDIL